MSRAFAVGFPGLLMIFGLLGFLSNHPQRLFQELGGLCAVRPFESDSINLDFPLSPDDDFNGFFHLYPHEEEFDGAVVLLPAKNGYPALGVKG
jgi:hypothetical protein